MRKETAATILVTALILLFTAPPVSAGSAGSPSSLTAPRATGLIDGMGLSTWFHSLMAWLGETLSGEEYETAAMSEGGTVEDPQEPQFSEPGMGISPMSAGVSDPNG